MLRGSLVLLLFIFTSFIPNGKHDLVEEPLPNIDTSAKLEIPAFSDINQIALEEALMAYNTALTNQDGLSKQSKLVLVDFSKPSYEKRFYVLDLTENKVIFEKHVAHGKNTGMTWAKNFSNTPNSNKSSLGLFRISEIYYGKHGKSLRLDGLEPGVNDNARKRAVVIHSAWYATQKFLDRYGRLGRSFGCPALPKKDYNEIVELIKDGSLLYIYHPSKNNL